VTVVQRLQVVEALCVRLKFLSYLVKDRFFYYYIALLEHLISREPRPLGVAIGEEQNICDPLTRCVYYFALHEKFGFCSENEPGYKEGVLPLDGFNCREMSLENLKSHCLPQSNGHLQNHLLVSLCNAPLFSIFLRLLNADAHLHC
jgi:hypothetical protein